MDHQLCIYWRKGTVKIGFQETLFNIHLTHTYRPSVEDRNKKKSPYPIGWKGIPRDNETVNSNSQRIKCPGREGKEGVPKVRESYIVPSWEFHRWAQINLILICTENFLLIKIHAPFKKSEILENTKRIQK